MLSMIVLGVFALKADFTQLSLWQRKTLSGQKQSLIICGDNHGKKKTGFQQAQELTAFLQEQGNGSILIEDTFDYRKSLDKLSDVLGDDERFQGLKDELQDFQVNRLDPYRRKSVVDGVFSGILLIPTFARELGIVCENVEFRQFITDLIHDTLKIINDHGYDEIFLAKQMIDSVYAEVKAFNDTLQLNTYYQEILQKLELIKGLYEQFLLTERPASEFFDFVCDVVLADPAAFDLTCLSYTSSNSYLVSEKGKTTKLYQQLLENKRLVHRKTVRDRVEADLMNHAFSALIDVYILHALYTKQMSADTGNIIALCAGLAHCSCIEELLPQFGYEHVAVCNEANGIVMADALQDIRQDLMQPSNNIANVVYAMVDGVKTAFDTIGSYLGLV